MSQSCAARARLRQKELLCPELLGDDQSRSRDTDEAEKSEKSEKSPLEKLALKGSCVKDGGEVHAMLLVAMRPEQRQFAATRPLQQSECQVICLCEAVDSLARLLILFASAVVR